MNWIDKPIAPSKSMIAGRLKSHRQRIDKLIERCDAGRADHIAVPTVKVLVPWHIDSTGCRARTVGNES